MPRQVTTGSEAQRKRQRRYRARLAVERRPEASAVDVAVAAAVAGLVAEAAAEDRTGGHTPTTAPEIVGRVVRAALTGLVEAGYAREPSAKAIRRRLRRYEFTPAGPASRVSS